MEKGFESWFQDQKFQSQSQSQSLNPNSLGTEFGSRPEATNPYLKNMVSPKAQERCGWFYGLPRYRQGLTPLVNSINKEKLPEAGSIPPKKFLVFDQSGDQTTLIYSAGIGAPSTRYQFPSFNDPVHVGECLKENDGDDSRSEMREDTEELNALLYSDNDDDDGDGGYEGNYSENEGHSPMEKEEVASSVGPTKRRKRENEGSIEETASSGINCCENDGNVVFDDYSCANNNNNNKRVRKEEEMNKTVNLLRNLIPGDKNGKNAIMVIDEAINYLTGLKLKAKALGLDSL